MSLNFINLKFMDLNYLGSSPGKDQLDSAFFTLIMILLIINIKIHKILKEKNLSL